jgi:hypothetical protein
MSFYVIDGAYEEEFDRLRAAPVESRSTQMPK